MVTVVTETSRCGWDRNLTLYSLLQNLLPLDLHSSFLWDLSQR